MVIQIDGIPAEVVRKRMKTLRLTVLPPDGRVRISAPLLLPNSVILAFAESKADWVRKQQEKMRKDLEKLASSALRNIGRKSKNDLVRGILGSLRF